jgi:hypothetical protein
MPDIIASQGLQPISEASIIPPITADNWYWYVGVAAIVMLFLRRNR